MKIIAMLLSLALSTGTAFSSTVLLTSDPNTGTTTTFTDTGVNSFGAGPASLDGFQVTGSPTVFSGNGTYALGSNGIWNQSWIATNDGNGSITFNLGGAYSLAGGLMNYGPGGGNDATLTALGTDEVTVIGTHDLVTLEPINTPGATNGDAFRGIESSSANLGYRTQRRLHHRPLPRSERCLASPRAILTSADRYRTARRGCGASSLARSGEASHEKAAS